ncbi:DUF4339 domain-containing protein [Roseimaritima sediminicola]|uniref:DUF4339 domain-containing protein n=1 Tax=Roseimaritima sediminicola TaxID=2662066 RepID=UPI0012982912|nr:DUF4339 domain-containing protein [Roseimaritima sediminicola]
MSEWFVRQNETEIGPVDGSGLLDMIREGAVKQDTLVRKNDSAWFEARSVGGLFEAASKSSTNYYCPECNAAVRKPPCVCPGCRIQLNYARAKVVENKIDGYEPAAKPKRSASVQNWLRRVQTRRQ